jgi:hypothetical protein
VAGSFDPEFAAARVLRDLRLQFFRLFMSGPEPALIMKDIVHEDEPHPRKPSEWRAITIIC